MSKQRISEKQREMLRDFDRDGEATDICAYDWRASFGHLAWKNRERVIDALRRKGLLDNDGITEAGRAAISGRKE